MSFEELRIEAEKTWHFHRTHNLSKDHCEAVMAISEAKKLFDKALKLLEEKK